MLSYCVTKVPRYFMYPQPLYLGRKTLCLQGNGSARYLPKFSFITSQLLLVGLAKSVTVLVGSVVNSLIQHFSQALQPQTQTMPSQLEQLECLRSEDTPHRFMITQVKTRSTDLEDIDQGQRSSHATHLLMLVIICIKYGKNPSRTIDATEWTRFSRSRPNDPENIGQGQRSLHATHPLMLMMICAKYGKNTSRIVDFFSRWKPKN